MKVFNVISLSSLLVSSALAADHVLIWPESAPQASGPWTPSRVGTENLTPDGKVLLPADENMSLWRLQIAPASNLGFSLGLPLINVPLDTLRIAQDFLAANSARPGVEPDSDNEWGAVRLANEVIPMYDPAVDEGKTPAYMEFKVIAADVPTVGDPSGLTPAPVRRDRGFIQVSLTENDFPVVAWSTRGKTLVEKLREHAGMAHIKPMVFGAGLMVGETRDGKMAATWGSMLSRPHPDLMQFSNFLGSSLYDSETGESNRTPALPLEAPLDSYASYRDMKEDYVANDFYRDARQRKAEVARIDWLFARGATFPHLKVAAGETTTEFAGREVRGATLHVPDEQRIALLTALGSEGLRIEGLSRGGGMLHVQFDAVDEYFTLEVGDPTGVGDPSGLLAAPLTAEEPFLPGWRTTKFVSAGTKDDQCWYHNFQSLDFGGGGVGNDVGCGPVAWTMLMGWWDHKGVPVSFKPRYYGSGIDNWQLGLADAPRENDNYVRSMMRDFRQHWIDPLYCNNFTGDCGTPPDKMVEGPDYFASALKAPYNAVYLLFLQKKLLGHSYTINYSWTSFNGINDHNKLARESIEKGWPSIMGIGFLKHYIVAYGYKEQYFELLPGKYYWSRAFLECNWGDGDDPVWHNFKNDYFFATKCRFWQSETEYSLP